MGSSPFALFAKREIRLHMKIDIEKANNQLRMLVEHVATGEEITITKAGSPVAKLVPAEAKFADTKNSKPYTEKQGQYLAFIHHHTKLRGLPPSQSEMQRYFRVTPPSVHQMVLTLEKRGLIKRTPRQARSIEILIPQDELPNLL